MAEKKLQGKANYSHFSLGKDLLEGWSAIKVDDDKYKITRSNGTEVIFSIGEEVKDIGMVELKNDNNLKVGKYTILTGENLLPNWQAVPKKGKNQYRVTDSANKNYFVTVDEEHEELGKITLDEYNNIITEKGSIPVAKKEYELTLLVFNDRDKAGFKCFFNCIEEGNSNNRKDGIPGVFYPPSGENKPGNFYERDKNKRMYNTAVFWPTKNEKYLNVKLRTMEDEQKELEAFKKVKDFEKSAKEINVPFEDVFGYTEAAEELERIKKDSWNTKLFNITYNHSFFKTMNKELNKKKEEEYSDSPSP